MNDAKICLYGRVMKDPNWYVDEKTGSSKLSFLVSVMVPGRKSDANTERKYNTYAVVYRCSNAETVKNMLQVGTMVNVVGDLSASLSTSNQGATYMNLHVEASDIRAVSNIKPKDNPVESEEDDTE